MPFTMASAAQITPCKMRPFYSFLLGTGLSATFILLVLQTTVFAPNRYNMSILDGPAAQEKAQENASQPTSSPSVSSAQPSPEPPKSVSRQSDPSTTQVYRNLASNETSTAGPASVTKSVWGTYPDWWSESWSRSAVSGQMKKFVGDKPLFPPCIAAPHKWEFYPFVEPRSYLKNSKNPCWFEQLRDRPRGLRCVPYFYLAGVAKCGTTDLAKRIKLHPEVFEGTLKEYHWWERDRFGNFDQDKPEKTVDISGGVSFREYTNKITGREIYDIQRELNEKKSSVRIFGDYSPSYLWDPQNWYALDGNQGCTEPRVIVGQHIRHVYPEAKVIMTFRHPTPRLYSRFLSRIPRTPGLRGSTPQDFHDYVIHGIKVYKKCFQTWSIRHCAYNYTNYKDSVVRLVEGMYPVFVADWLRVWPREQMFLMRYEDYGGHERERLIEVMAFLGLSPLNHTEMDKLLEMPKFNPGTDHYNKYGQMLEKTKKALDEFYQPFITQFAEILQDERFLWRDTPH